MSSEKKCSSCSQHLPLAHFHADKSKSSGYKSSCKKCVNLKRRKPGTLKRKRRTKAEINASSNNTERECTTCSKTLPLSKFRLTKGRTVYTCKPCESVKRKERYEKEKDPEISKRKQAEKLSLALQGFAQLRSGIKKCDCCNIWRDDSEFRSRSRSISGTSNKCQSCTRNQTEIEHGEMFIKIKSQAEQRMQRIIKKTLENKGLL